MFRVPMLLGSLLGWRSQMGCPRERLSPFPAEPDSSLTNRRLRRQLSIRDSCKAEEKDCGVDEMHGGHLKELGSAFNGLDTAT